MMSSLTELRFYWTVLCRAVIGPVRGLGKWRLDSRDPHTIYHGLSEVMRQGRLEEVVSMKTRTVPESEIETVYVYTGPYSDVVKVLCVAQELWAQVEKHGWELERPLSFKTDLQTAWQDETDVRKDGQGKPVPWQGKSWLFRYDGVHLTLNEHMMRLHERLEHCIKRRDDEMIALRRLLPNEVFAGPLWQPHNLISTVLDE